MLPHFILCQFPECGSPKRHPSARTHVSAPYVLSPWVNSALPVYSVAGQGFKIYTDPQHVCEHCHTGVLRLNARDLANTAYSP